MPNSVHEAREWVIAQIAPDFDLLDVWDLPAEGTVEEFESFLELMSSLDPTKAGPFVSRALFWVRLRLGAMFGWDDARKRPIPGHTETTLSARLPAHLRGSAETPQLDEAAQRVAAGFVPLYRTADEWAAEISNETVHGVLHLSWVGQSSGRYRGRMAVYVKQRGKLGAMYLALIQPFRHLIVYPALTRQIGRMWATRAS